MEKSNIMLPTIHTDEKYDNLQLDSEIFRKAAEEIIDRHHLSNEPLSRFEGTNIVFAYGSNRVIKIFPPLHQHQFTSEVVIMKHLQDKISVNTPNIELVSIFVLRCWI